MANLAFRTICNTIINQQEQNYLNDEKQNDFGHLIFFEILHL